MSVEKLLDIPHSAIFLLAPPAWGKTSRLVNWYAESHLQLLVYISPLRALADEVEQRFEQFQVLNLKKISQLSGFFGRKRALIITPERVNEELLAWLVMQKQVMLFFDEFHLYDHWASFRPQMLSALTSLCSLSITCMMVTATLDSRKLEYWQFYFSLNYEQLVTVDVGNYLLQKYPDKVRSWFGDYKMYLLYLLWKKRIFEKQRRTVLCFCRYREEVEACYNYFKERGFAALYCVGGQTQAFRHLLGKQERPEVIISTIALSHGVNLPDISDIFFSYKEDNRDYFIQMVARAGRKGESYTVWLPGKLSIPHFF